MIIYFKTLDKSFVVQKQTCNLIDLGSKFNATEINEYATSKADLVIKKDRSHVKEMVCCMVFSAVPSCNFSAMVAELKLDNTTIYPVVKSMSVVAASITIDA